MECDEAMWDRSKDGGGKVKSSRGSRDGAEGLGIDGLVSLVIGFVRSAFEVRGERHVSVLFQIWRSVELDDPFAFGKNVQNLGDCAGDGNANAGLELAAGAGEAFPFGVAERLEEEDLDCGRF